MLELKCFEILQSLDLVPMPGETCVQAVERLVGVADTVLRPYRYPMHQNVHAAFTTYWRSWGRRDAWTEPGGYVNADIFNTFQAGYTAREASNGTDSNGPD